MACPTSSGPSLISAGVSHPTIVAGTVALLDQVEGNTQAAEQRPWRQPSRLFACQRMQRALLIRLDHKLAGCHRLQILAPRIYSTPSDREAKCATYSNVVELHFAEYQRVTSWRPASVSVCRASRYINLAFQTSFALPMLDRQWRVPSQQSSDALCCR